MSQPRLPFAPKEAGLTRLDLLVVGSAHREGGGGGGPHADGGEVVVVKLEVADKKPRADGCLAGGSLALSSRNIGSSREGDEESLACFFFF